MSRLPAPAGVGVGHVADHPDALVGEVERTGQPPPRRREVGRVGHLVELLDVVDAEALDQRVLELVGDLAALPHHPGQPEGAGAGEREARLGAEPLPAAPGEVGGDVDRGQREHLRRGLADQPAGDERREAGPSAPGRSHRVGDEGGEDGLATQKAHLTHATDQYASRVQAARAKNSSTASTARCERCSVTVE